tara:strand:- start:2971 stop:3267 length:297 start_codon:yes stop_codon:yes gene_type:complete
MKFSKSFSGFSFATVKEWDGSRTRLRYLVGNTDQDIMDYCWKEDSTQDLEILEYYDNAPPFTVTKHFEWIGKGRRPAQLSVSTPFNYEDPKYKPPEKW